MFCQKTAPVAALFLFVFVSSVFGENWNNLTSDTPENTEPATTFDISVEPLPQSTVEPTQHSVELQYSSTSTQNYHSKLKHEFQTNATPNFLLFPRKEDSQQFWNDHPEFKGVPDLPANSTNYPDWLIKLMSRKKPIKSFNERPSQNRPLPSFQNDRFIDAGQQQQQQQSINLPIEDGRLMNVPPRELPTEFHARRQWLSRDGTSNEQPIVLFPVRSIQTKFVPAVEMLPLNNDVRNQNLMWRPAADRLQNIQIQRYPEVFDRSIFYRELRPNQYTPGLENNERFQSFEPQMVFEEGVDRSSNPHQRNMPRILARNGDFLLRQNPHFRSNFVVFPVEPIPSPRRRKRQTMGIHRESPRLQEFDKNKSKDIFSGSNWPEREDSFGFKDFQFENQWFPYFSPKHLAENQRVPVVMVKLDKNGNNRPKEAEMTRKQQPEKSNFLFVGGGPWMLNQGSANDGLPQNTDQWSVNDGRPQNTDQRSANDGLPQNTDQWSVNDGRPQNKDQWSANDGLPQNKDPWSANDGQPQNTDQWSANDGQPQNTDQWSANDGQPQNTDQWSANDGRPQNTDQWSANDARPQNTDQWSANDRRPQNKDQWSVNDGRPQNTDQWSANDGRPQHTDQWSANDGRPQNTDQWSANDGRPQNKDQWSVNDGRPQNTDQWSANDGRPQNKDQWSANDGRPQNTDQWSANDGRPQNTDHGSANDGLPQNTPTIDNSEGSDRSSNSRNRNNQDSLRNSSPKQLDRNNIFDNDGNGLKNGNNNNNNFPSQNLKNDNLSHMDSTANIAPGGVQQTNSDDRSGEMLVATPPYSTFNENLKEPVGTGNGFPTASKTTDRQFHSLLPVFPNWILKRFSRKNVTSLGLKKGTDVPPGGPQDSGVNRCLSNCSSATNPLDEHHLKDISHEEDKTNRTEKTKLLIKNALPISTSNFLEDRKRLRSARKKRGLSDFDLTLPIHHVEPFNAAAAVGNVDAVSHQMAFHSNNFLAGHEGFNLDQFRKTFNFHENSMKQHLGKDMAEVENQRNWFKSFSYPDWGKSVGSGLLEEFHKNQNWNMDGFRNHPRKNWPSKYSTPVVAVPKANPNQISYTTRFRYRFGIYPGYTNYKPNIDSHRVYYEYDPHHLTAPDTFLPFRSY